MATVGGFSRHHHLAELLEPLQTGEGWLTPTARQALARQNLGIVAGPTLDFATVSAIEGDWRGEGTETLLAALTALQALATA